MFWIYASANIDDAAVPIASHYVRNISVPIKNNSIPLERPQYVCTNKLHIA
jgi:hypothetical protein